MKLTEYIASLQDLEKEHGNLDVYEQNFGSVIMGACKPVGRPTTKYLKILSGREHVVKVHCEILDKLSTKGSKVVFV